LLARGKRGTTKIAAPREKTIHEFKSFFKKKYKA